MQNSRIHPLFITAAVAVIITCGVAVASMIGLWPNSKAAMGENMAQIEEAPPLASTDSENPQKDGLAPTDLKPVSTALDAQPEATKATNKDTIKKSHTQEYHSKPKAKPQEPEFASSQRFEPAPPPARPVEICHACGRVVDVRPVRIEPEGSGVGAVAGGVAGALLGKQFGNGNGQKALTVAGAVGGALLGNKIEKDRRTTTVYDVVVEFEDGSSQTFREGSGSNFQVGDRVKSSNGQLTFR